MLVLPGNGCNRGEDPSFRAQDRAGDFAAEEEDGQYPAIISQAAPSEISRFAYVTIPREVFS